MIGLLVAVLITWIVVRQSTYTVADVLGLNQFQQRAKEFLAGFIFMAIVGVINLSWQADFKQITYEPNPDFGVINFLGSGFWIFKAVLFEELLFRGVLLFLLIKRIGIVKACLVSSAIFGVYHWFSYEIFGSRLILMIYVFLITGCGGWMFAYAYAKTKSLFAPIGLHLGWNMVTAIVFSSGPLGNQWLVPQGEASPYSSEWITLLFFSLQAIIAPGLVTWYLETYYKTSG